MAQMANVGLIHANAAMVMGTSVGVAAADEFFNGDEGLVSVWDFDYDTMIDFETQFQWAKFKFLPPLWFSACCCYPCFLRKNVEWATRSYHVALTVDGIRAVSDRHPTLCGFSWQDKGRESKTVPFDKITDCDVQEPAGAAFCCCVPRVLSTVHVDTASSGSKDANGVTVHELVLTGLKSANEFKQAVWSMKRAQAAADTKAAPVSQGTAPMQAQMNSEYLREIRDELRTLNDHLRKP